MLKLLSKLLLIVVLLFMSSSANALKFKGVDYEIINRSASGNAKCSLDIKLSEKLSQGDLGELAIKLREKEGRGYARMFILYYLPDMKLGSGAWASTNFNPYLDINVIGATLSQERVLKASPVKAQGKVLGKWFDESFGGMKILIVQKGEKLFLSRTASDGSSAEDELIVKGKGMSKKYVKPGDNHFGEYYQIDPNGYLIVGDNEGVIKKTAPMK